MFALAMLIAFAFGALGAVMALRTGSGEAVQGLFPLLFVMFFLSSLNLPRNLIEIGWFRTVATWNPVSYLIEGLRSLVLTGWDSHGARSRVRGRGRHHGGRRHRVRRAAGVPDGAHVTSSRTLSVAVAVAKRSLASRTRTRRSPCRRSSSR